MESRIHPFNLPFNEIINFSFLDMKEDKFVITPWEAKYLRGRESTCLPGRFWELFKNTFLELLV